MFAIKDWILHMHACVWGTSAAFLSNEQYHHFLHSAIIKYRFNNDKILIGNTKHWFTLLVIITSLVMVLHNFIIGLCGVHSSQHLCYSSAPWSDHHLCEGCTKLCPPWCCQRYEITAVEEKPVGNTAARSAIHESDSHPDDFMSPEASSPLHPWLIDWYFFLD